MAWVQGEVRLPFREPFDAPALLGFLGQRAVPGVEVFEGGVYRRSLTLPGGPGVVELAADRGAVRCRMWLTAEEGGGGDGAVCATRCRALLDLDADPQAIGEVLSRDESLAPLVRRAPGLRIPGHVDGAELAVRAVLGQQVTVSGARTLAGRLVQRYGTPLGAPVGGVTHLFPAPATLAGGDLDGVGLPGARRGALRAVMRAVAAGDVALQPTASAEERAAVTRRLLGLPGIGPWTAAYIAMRALGERDAFLAADVGVRRAAERLGWAADPPSLEQRSEQWRPWRSYATLYLWSSLA